jgi:hypothetical protein
MEQQKVAIRLEWLLALSEIEFTVRADVRNMVTKKNILTVDRIVFVSLDSAGLPLPHGYTSVCTERDRIPKEHE